MSTEAVDQVANLRDNLLPPSQADDPTTPRMPFRSALVLTRQQEDDLVAHCDTYLRDIRGQLGREDDNGAGAGDANGTTRNAAGGTKWAGAGNNPKSFLGKRERYTLRYNSYVEDRRTPNTVFWDSNLTASLGQRITRQSSAKTIAYFLGQPDDTDWFSSEAVGAEDEVVSDKIKKHSRWKVDQCEVKHRFADAIEWARVRGEAVLKVTHLKQGQIYQRTATILVDEAAEPILDAHGDYIVQGDATVAEMQEAPPPGLVTRAVGAVKDFMMGPPAGAAQPGLGNYGAPPAAEGVPSDGVTSDQMGNSAPSEDSSLVTDPLSPPMQATGRQILKRDGVTVLPDVPIWSEQVITRELVTFEGPDVEVVDYQDFFCPINAKSVQVGGADFVGHTYDKSVMQVAKMFRGQFGEGDAAIADIVRAVERLRELTEAGNQPKAAAGQPREEMGEQAANGSKGQVLCELAEICLTYDADGDGNEEEIFLIMDRKNKAPIYYEHLANVTVRGLRPYYVLRPRAVAGRWYGLGDMEYLEPESDFVDLQICRHNYRGSKSGITTLWRPFNTLEGDLNPDLVFNDGKTYTPKAGVPDNEVLSYVSIPTDNNNLEFLLNFMMQGAQLKSGTLNGADRAMSSLPSSDTLGEEELITQSGDELFAHSLATMFPTIKAALAAVIDVTYANMNRTEVFNFFNGEANEVLSLTPEDVRDLAMNVSLSLSRTQQRKTLESSGKAQEIVDWFYALPPMLQERVSTFTRQRLKALGVSQADRIIEPLDPMLLPPPPEGAPPAEMLPATSAV